MDKIRKFLPVRKSNLGRPPSIGTVEVETRFRWPQLIEYIPDRIKSIMMGMAMEKAIFFFFKNFAYTFGGKVYLQKFGGPIGARITMAVARLVMQEWKDRFDEILMKSNITELLSGLYVDDGRSLQRKLKYGERFDRKEKCFKVDLNLAITDELDRIDRNELA